jgi:hypothetical protein
VFWSGTIVGQGYGELVGWQERALLWDMEDPVLDFRSVASGFVFSPIG